MCRFRTYAPFFRAIFEGGVLTPPLCDGRGGTGEESSPDFVNLVRWCKGTIIQKPQNWRDWSCCYSTIVDDKNKAFVRLKFSTDKRKQHPKKRDWSELPKRTPPIHRSLLINGGPYKASYTILFYFILFYFIFVWASYLIPRYIYNNAYFWIIATKTTVSN